MLCGKAAKGVQNGPAKLELHVGESCSVVCVSLAFIVKKMGQPLLGSFLTATHTDQG